MTMLDTEFLPARDKQSRALMVVLHGLGDSTAGFRWLPPALALPWMNYLLVNAPDPYFGGYSWYDFASEQAGEGIARSRRLLFDLLDRERQEGWPTGQTVLFGFSQGCLMTWETGLRYPHRLAGLVGISGYAHDPQTAVKALLPMAKEQRFLITHGTWDPMIPFPQVKAQVKLLEDAGLRIEWHEFAKEHTIAGEEELDVIRKFVVAGFRRKGDEGTA
jgi:phospholipase/carboxylesterase